MNFGKLVREFRTVTLGLTQAQFCDWLAEREINLSRVSLSRLETGATQELTPVTHDRLVAIMRLGGKS